MNKQKKLLRSDIRYECGDAFYERGRSYFERGMVITFTVKSEGALFAQINAAVQGSHKDPYRQNIRIVWRPDYRAAEIEGDCTCPVGYNCKHVAAVCLMYQSPNQNASSQEAKPNCLDWLDSLHQRAPVQHDIRQDFIAYILKPGNAKYEFTIDLLVTKEKKAGGLHKGRKTVLNSLRYSYSHLNYVQPEDQEIAKLLTALNPSFKDEPLIAGATGYLALSKLLESGRLFWKDVEQAPLKKGTDRELKFSWQTADNGDYQLTAKIDPPAMLLLTDPPQYLDEALGLIGPFRAPHLSSDQLATILAAPRIPPEYADEFSQRLIIEHPGLPIPAPKKVELIEADQLSPTPKLLLFGHQLNAQQYTHFMAVSFSYGEWTISATPTEDYSVVKTNRGLIRIKRDIGAEQQAVHRLTELGFITAPSIESGVQELLLFSPAKTPMDSAARWGEFLQDSLLELEQDGWLIDIDESFLLNFQTAHNWDAQISEGQQDWFEMTFNIEIDGQPLPLLPLIMPVLENYDPENLPEMLSIPLGAHNYLSLPSSKIKPFLNVLIELFNSSTMGQDGSLRLSRFNAAMLADLEEHNHGIFSINGGKELRELGQKLKNFSGIENVAPPDNLQAELRPYQQHGLNWLQFLREYKFSGILADDMGLGKTIQTLSHLLLEKQSGRMNLPSLIIAPTSLMSNWRRETERFTPDLKILILQGTERKQLFYKIRDYDLILTTYPLLPRDEETLLEHEYHYLILDEAQTVKNPLSKAAQLVRRIKANHRLCLTGTPMENHLGELWAQFDFLMPGFLGDLAAFKKHYRTPIEIYGDGEKRAKLSRRVAPFMLRRTKHEVATELPPKTEIIRSVPLYQKQAALYESIRLTMEKKVRDAIAERGMSRSHITILDALLKLRQTCCDPRTLSLKEAQKVQESAKLDLLMEMLPEQLEEGRRILVFSQFTRMIALIENELNARKIGYAKLTGQTRNRDEAIERFKSGEVNVFLISLKAGGVGLNLTEADTVIIYDPWWNPAAESQAADRAHRIGQDKPVFIYKLITENTVEEKIIAMQDKKRALAEGIYKGGDKEESLKLTAEDLTALFEPL
ncbi:DEAD/DEAH box helicase [Candidatus Methylobacter oryzae]|uniref:Helicase SNF2 n=1 Tax=Candidatus Methylobacter oryzae TaxID=2497749 RepID=A0ABY3CC44_9GAMM|nr:DEAD/DEAH box helicase [Candidatus Methylobacter oryzae]TRW98018.1 helicase SNF2 [Candidatus Methylobacter oryzae]